MKSFFYSVVGVIGIILLIGGFFVGLYMGIWWAFFGGIVTFIEAVKATPVDAYGIAYGITRIVFTVPIGWICFLVTSWVGYALADMAEKRL